MNSKYANYVQSGKVEVEGAEVMVGPGNPGKPGFPGEEWRAFIPD